MGNYYLYKIAYWITRSVPLKLAYILGMTLADLQYYLSKEDRSAVKENLKTALNTDKVPNRMVRQVFRNFGKYLTDFFTQTKHVTTDYINEHVHILGTENLNELLKHKKGGIIVSAHLGNWEMAGAALSKLGYPLSVIALPHVDPRVNRFFNEQREFFGVSVIPATTAVRRTIEHLKDNRLVAILAERDFGHNGMPMDFLGKKTMIPKGAAIFSLKTGAPIVTGFFLREPNNDFKIIFSKPIYPPALNAGKLNDNDIADYIKSYLPAIEDVIREHPTQWLLFRRFEIL